MILKERINAALDTLQGLMESNVHLKDYLKVSEAIDEVSKYFNVLSEEDREYLDACKYALHKQLRWDVK